MNFRKEIGKQGEEIATQYLKEKGYQILERNFYARKGEIDIIAKEKREIVFVEVKTRSNHQYGNPAEAVDVRKIHHIYDTANYYLYRKKIENNPTRFDVIEIDINVFKQIYHINHIKNIDIY